MKLSQDQVSRFRRSLLNWYDKNKRDLPWRQSSDPYAIWVSEIMLQQTQVQTVIPYYHKFLKRFPSIAALARAPSSEVLSVWSGLGYYRRARLLHQGAQELMARWEGCLPQEVEQLLKLPGIGPYTAGAIASIAFGKAAPLVDGNVVRVLSRYLGLIGHAKAKALHQQVWEISHRLLSARRPGDFNQALMELGATVCRPRLPACHRCPLQTSCHGLAVGEPESFPETPPSPKTLKLNRMVAVVQQNSKILLVQPLNQRWFQGMWALPGEFLEAEEFKEAKLKQLLSCYGELRWSQAQALPSTSHSITHHRITTQAWLIQAQGKPQGKPSLGGVKFFPLSALDELALPNFDRKVLQAGGFAA